VHAPVRCVWFAAAIALLLGLLSFAGPNAIGAVFSLSVIAQYMAYSIPITARHLGGGKKKIPRGPFHLGIFVCYIDLSHRLLATNVNSIQSLPIAVVAVSFMALVSVVFLFPSYPNPGAQNMNYAVVVFGTFRYPRPGPFITHYIRQAVY